MANLGYILKQSVVDACSSMTDEEFRRTIIGLFDYATKGKVPSAMTPLQKVVFYMEKPSIDTNNEKWERKRIEFEREANNPDKVPF